MSPRRIQQLQDDTLWKLSLQNPAVEEELAASLRNYIYLSKDQLRTCSPIEPYRLARDFLRRLAKDGTTNRRHFWSSSRTSIRCSTLVELLADYIILSLDKLPPRLREPLMPDQLSEAQQRLRNSYLNDCDTDEDDLNTEFEAADIEAEKQMNRLEARDPTWTCSRSDCEDDTIPGRPRHGNNSQVVASSSLSSPGSPLPRTPERTKTVSTAVRNSPEAHKFMQAVGAAVAMSPNASSASRIPIQNPTPPPSVTGLDNGRLSTTAPRRRPPTPTPEYTGTSRRERSSIGRNQDAPAMAATPNVVKKSTTPHHDNLKRKAEADHPRDILKRLREEKQHIVTRKANAEEEMKNLLVTQEEEERQLVARKVKAEAEMRKLSAAQKEENVKLAKEMEKLEADLRMQKLLVARQDKNATLAREVEELGGGLGDVQGVTRVPRRLGCRLFIFSHIRYTMKVRSFLCLGIHHEQ